MVPSLIESVEVTHRLFWPCKIAGLICVSALVGCGSSALVPPRDLDESHFAQGTEYERMLCFDLRSDSPKPTTGVLVRTTPADSAVLRTIALPFHCRAVRLEPSLLLTYGRYPKYTLLHYIESNNGSGLFAIDLAPDTLAFPDEIDSLDRLAPGIYFSRDEGRLRRFVVINDPDNIRVPKEVLSLHDAPIDSIAVALPIDSEGREVVQGRTVDPVPIETVEKTHYFATNGFDSPKRIELKYIVPPTTWQLLVLEYGIKLLGILALPAVTLGLLPHTKVTSPFWRKVAVIGLITCQVVILAVVFGVTWLIREDFANNILDVSLVFVGVVVQAVITLLKKE